ncbi:MAG: bifunctional serine/threonine-protein kinase/formylglycine-generating enzyme family protein [Planctomycetota bacterium]
MPSDSDLLFAVLAQRLGFLAPRELAGLARDPGTGSNGLREAIIAAAKFGDKDRSAVDAAVAAHLGRSGGNARAALSALPMEKIVREALLGAASSDGVREALEDLVVPEVGTTVVIAPPSLDRYRLGTEIGRGGLGKVVEAHDHALNRDVAIKLALENLPGELEGRFVREVEITARLEHPNIVPVHDFGVIKSSTGGRHLFLCMKRIRGRDLGQLLVSLANGESTAVRSYSRARLLAVFQDVCLGMAFAHSKGVIHRDLKPSNVMVGEFGETLIVDWGIAKVRGEAPSPLPQKPRPTPTVRPNDPSATVVLASDDSSITLEGDVVGTPAYMAPEQADGRVAEMDERSDTWSLGAILYEILTLRAPFEAESAAAVLERVRAGKVEPPSQRLKRQPPIEAARAVCPEIPPELDAIVLKAMARRRDDRFGSAMDLHRDIQLYLEGSSERERRRRQAQEWVERGRGHLRRFRALKDEVIRQAEKVKELGTKVRGHEPLAAKRPLWDAEELEAAMREERIEAYSSATADFGHALAVDAGAEEAEAGLCELFLDRYEEAEGAKDQEEMLLNRRALEAHDRKGTYRTKLDAPGRLTIRTFAWGCDCLSPVKAPGWKVEFEREASLAWADGFTRPGEKIKDWDEPVPKAMTSPPGAAFGHTEKCPRKEVRGARVTIACYAESGRRLVEGAPREIGVTPVEGVELPHGSYLCVLHPPDPALLPVRVPVRIDRNGSWTQEVNFYRAADIPDGLVQIAGGPYLSSGVADSEKKESVRLCSDYFIARFPVTIGDYSQWLDDLAAKGRAEEVAARAPRDSTGPFGALENGRFRFTVPVPGTRQAVEPGFPLFNITWHDALAYCAWRSARDGRFFTLPHHVQYEKAARGVDGRTLPWGERYDGTFSHTNTSFADGFRMMPAGSFSTDESPYGVRDLAGGMSTLCLNTIAGPFALAREWKGGNWTDAWLNARSGTRNGTGPGISSRAVGARLVMPVFRYAAP